MKKEEHLIALFIFKFGRMRNAVRTRPARKSFHSCFYNLIETLKMFSIS